MMQRLKPSTASAVFGLTALSVMASSNIASEESGWYGGFKVGRSYARTDNGRVAGSLSTAGFATTSIRDGDRDTAYKLFGGYRFGSHVTLEGGYFDLRTFGVQGANFDLLGTLPFNKRLAAFARVGATRAQTNDTFAASGLVRVLDSSAGASATNYKVGVGLQYDLFRSLGVRAEAERYRIADAAGNRGDLDLYSLGLLYRFSRGAPPLLVPAAVAPAPGVRSRRSSSR